MNDRDIIEIYKKEIELFLGTLGIFKGNSIINIDEIKNAENKKFIKQKMSEMKAGNFNNELMDTAIDELLPYLRQKN